MATCDMGARSMIRGLIIPVSTSAIDECALMSCVALSESRPNRANPIAGIAKNKTHPVKRRR